MAELDFSAGSMDWDSLEKNLGANITSDKKSYKDDRFWSLSRDENENGAALIRLLPDPEGTPFIQVYNHAFQSFDNVNKKKRWYINNSPQTINESCPASDLWSAIYNEGSEDGKLEAKNFSRKIQFYTNIKVIKDPSNPQNDGKIFVWKFGTKLKDKIMAALNPSETDRQMGEEPKQLFNPLTGCNIKLKIQKAAGFLNYDATTIEAVSSIYPDAETAKADILENAHKLSEFNSPDAFESYEELLKKLKYVLECYSPKNLSPERFKAIVDPVLGAKTERNAQPVESSVAPTQTIESTKTVETPSTKTVETPSTKTVETPSTKTVEEDDSLSFLDDL